MKHDSQNGVGVRARRVLELPVWVLGLRWWFQNKFFMHPGASEAPKNTKMEPRRKNKGVILCNAHPKQHCSHDPVDASANTFARAAS